MSSPSLAGPAQPLNRKAPRSSKRATLRNATFILPSTNERIRRQITLRYPATFDGSSREDAIDGDGSLLSLQRRFSSAGTFDTALDNIRLAAKKFWKWTRSRTGRGVLKCSVAYIIASMATFLPFVSNLLGKQDGKHMVSTIVVYFHPARSAGSMVEAIILGVAAVLYASFISISSMAVSVLCETQFGLIELGYVIVLVVFCGGGLGLVGWVKQKFGLPLLNVACSLASLSIITVITKENAVQTGVFSDDKIAQMTQMVVLAIFITAAVNLILWPVSARRELRQTMIDATDAFGEMLTTITQSFLNGTEADLKSTAFQNSTRRYKSVIAQLTRNLKEAKAEHYILGTESEYSHEARLVNCMQRLAQAIGGLRSAALTQFALLIEPPSKDTPAPSNSIRHSLPQSPGSYFSTLKGPHERFAVLAAIDEASDESSEVEGAASKASAERFSKEGLETPSLPMARTPAEIFTRFIIYLGPSMKSLAYTLSQILQELPFGKGPDFEIKINEHFRTSLKDALKLYSDHRAEALKQLYKNKEMAKERAESVEADFEEVAASCGHFSFSLQDFGEEMQVYLEILEDLKNELDAPNRRSWSWLRIWQKKTEISRPGHENYDAEREPLINRENDLPKILPDVLVTKGSARILSKKNPSIYSRVLKVIRFFERDDIRFAIKVGAGATLWAMFAFIPATRPIYEHWRGEWGLLSYMLVCSMTLGASNTTGFARFLGTIIGATIAIIVWLMCQGNPIALVICCWFVCLGCFYIIVALGNAPFGRYILLTYNLSALYAYSLSISESKNDDDEGGINPLITEIALHRVVAVSCGIVWGLIITRVVWPISAREKFRDGLAMLWLRMGVIWKRDPLSSLQNGDTTGVYTNFQEEFALQKYVARLEILRAASKSEFELRGPFPQKEFGRIMESTNKMLDAFHAMNVVIQKDLKASPGEAAILKFTAPERAQLCATISHLFQVLASSMKLEYHLTDDLPTASSPRDRLLAKIFQFRKNDSAPDTGPVAKDEDYALLYAYVLVTGQLAEEIEKVEAEIEGLFGLNEEENEGVLTMYS